MPVEFERVPVTPEIAKRFIRDKAANQRKEKPSKIKAYARDMKEGRWDSDTGETIKFHDGKLIDGLNRMHAVVLAGVPIEFDVAYTTSDRAMIVIDTGAVRTGADTLRIAESNAAAGAAPIVRWIIAFDFGQYRGAGGQISPTNSEIAEAYAKDPALYDAAALRGADCGRAGLGQPGALGTAYVLFTRIDPELTHQFFDALVSGANLPETHPVLTLRNRLMRVKLDRTTRPEQLALTIRAWNALRTGKTLDRIMITRSGELTNSNFPMPK